MVAVLVSRLLGLVRDRLLASTFYIEGSQWQLDVYFAAFRIPDMIFQLLVLGALSAAFIPVYSHFLSKKEKEAQELARSVITLSVIGFSCVAIGIYIFAYPLSNLIAPDFDPIELELMANLTRIMLFAQFFFVISNFYTGILQSHQRFLIPAIAPILYNVGIIFGITVLSPYINIYGPAVGVVIGAILHLLIQIPIAYTIGFSYRPKANIKHKGVRQIGKLMLPRTAALAVTQLELTIAVFLSSSLADGSLSIFYFAQHLQALPVGLFGLTIGQAALPMLSKEDHNIKRFQELFLSSFKQILYFALPACVLLLVLRVPLVRIAYGAKSFPWDATLLTGRVVAAFAISVAALAVIQLLIRAFYALQDTITPLVVGAFSVFLNVVLAIWFIKGMQMDVVGLGLAVSIAGIVQAVILFIALNHKVKTFPPSCYLPSLIKMLTATALTAIFLWLPMRFLDTYILDTTRTIELVILTVVTSGIGFSVYVIFSKILQIEEMDQFLAILKKFGSWKKILSESGEAVGETASPQSAVITED